MWICECVEQIKRNENDLYLLCVLKKRENVKTMIKIKEKNDDEKIVLMFYDFHACICVLLSIFIWYKKTKQKIWERRGGKNQEKKNKGKRKGRGREKEKEIIRREETKRNTREKKIRITIWQSQQ